jgi:LPXTG-motif cell wall-anchored protein
MTRTRASTAVGLALLVGLVATLLSSAPTQAEPKKLLVSSTGVGNAWADNLTRPLFDGVGPFVPRDQVPDRFYVKNNSKQPARATLAVIDRGASNDLAELLSFTVNVGGVESDVPVLVDSKKKCKSYVTGGSIPPGGVQPVDVTLRFADASGQRAMDETASVDFVLTLSQVGPKGKVDICGAQAVAEPYQLCSQPSIAVVNVLGRSSCPEVKGSSAIAGAAPASGAVGSGHLAETGAPRSTGSLLGLAVALLASGALLVVRRRPAD